MSGSIVVPVEDLLFYKLKGLITEQSEGEWTDEMIVKDAHHFANHLRPLLAAAPAPSSLAGGSGLAEFMPETTGVQSRYVIVHQLRASADIQDGATKRETGWATTSDRAELMRRAADAIERLSALSPEAPAREGSRIAELEFELSAKTHTLTIADEQIERLEARIKALTPRHEAQAPTCQKCGGEVQGWTCQECGASFRENDEGSLVFARHEAPAEGAGVRIDWQQQDAVAGALHAVLPLDVDWQHMRVAGKAFVDTLLALRARSSAPEALEVRTHPTGEAIQDALIAGFLHGVGMGPWDDMHDYIAVCARDYAKGQPLPVRAAAPSADHAELTRLAEAAREEALGNLLAVIHGDGGHRALEVGVEQAAAEAEKIVARLLSSAPEAREGEAWGTYPSEVTTGTTTAEMTAAPSADKLRIAADALDRIATVDMGGGFLGALACRQVANEALAALKAEGC